MLNNSVFENDDANKIIIKLLTFWEEDARSGGWAAILEYHDVETGKVSRKYTPFGLTWGKLRAEDRSEFESQILFLILKRVQNIKKCVLNFLVESGGGRFKREKNWSFVDVDLGHQKVFEVLKKLKELEGIDLEVNNINWEFVNPKNDEEFDNLRFLAKSEAFYG